MNVRKSRLARLVVVTVVASLPVLGMAGVASAKKTLASTCAKHPNRAKCQTGGSTGGGKGGSGPNIIVTVDPNGTSNPLFEVGQSEVYAVVQVETLANFSGDEVTISSNQLLNSCTTVNWDSIATGSDVTTTGGSVTVYLDNEGNATVIVQGLDCAPGTDLVEADLAVAPFYTATQVVTVNPPGVTPPGVFGEPQTSGNAEEVESGDTPNSGDSDIYAVFFVEENPVYAEQPVEIGSTQLEDRCQTGWIWIASNQGIAPSPSAKVAYTSPVYNTSPPGTTPTTFLDDDGNAAFIFKGTSCAAGPSTVVADVLAGTHDTFTTTFTVLPPQVTV